MDTEFNEFPTDSLDRTFNSSPTNIEVSDEVQAREIFDYQHLTKYASVGRTVSKGIIGLASLSVLAGILMGGIQLGAGNNIYPRVNDLSLTTSTIDDSIHYSFSIDNPEESLIYFVVESSKKKEEFNVSLSIKYEGEVVDLGYDLDVVCTFEVETSEGVREQRKTEIMRTISTMNSKERIYNNGTK